MGFHGSCGTSNTSITSQRRGRTGACCVRRRRTRFTRPSKGGTRSGSTLQLKTDCLSNLINTQVFIPYICIRGVVNFKRIYKFYRVNGERSRGSQIRGKRGETRGEAECSPERGCKPRCFHRRDAVGATDHQSELLV